MTKLPPVSKEPFLLKGPNHNILILHGFTGTPYDVLPLALALNNKGHLCRGPLLFGHGTNPAELNKINAKNWINQAERELAVLQSPCFIIGLSMGGLLGAILASKHKNKVKGLILLAPAFHLNKIIEFAIIASNLGLHKILPVVSKLGKGADVADIEAHITPSYKEVGLKGLLQFSLIRDLALASIGQVKCPTFAIFGKKDRTINVKKSLLVCLENNIEIEVLSESRHVLPIDLERDYLNSKIIDFIEHVSEKK